MAVGGADADLLRRNLDLHYQTHLAQLDLQVVGRLRDLPFRLLPCEDGSDLLNTILELGTRGLGDLLAAKKACATEAARAKVRSPRVSNNAQGRRKAGSRLRARSWGSAL